MNTQLKTLKILLLLTTCLLGGLALAFMLRPQPMEARLAMGDSKLGGDFTLMSAAGPVSLADYRGKVSVIYIGYASCPDVCPTALAVMTQSLKQLPEAQREQVQGIFISVDPERDTPEKLADYTAFFSPQIVGITGTREQIDTVVRQYGAFYRKVEMKDSAMGYAVDHSSRLYVVNPQGKLVDTLLHNSTPRALTTRLLDILNTQG
ncbi:MAG: SCO family protein [Oceanospirillales bacterium]|uniref:Protein SCO1/2 n=1 Tax=Marinobacterium halophilum TaxID=267374 RepID=A0A2P8EUQ9_9GAMM|nr:SCO family protein [Marinobacterium halophilum]MBR9827282.1 SCO family protein [Oceanospirillales bacterium]PSL13207.1 protein SCO1/2 [Marinobacterium halophilum]